MDTDKDIWGEDALEFKCAFNRALLLPEADTDPNVRPERWESPPKAASEDPGVWSNLMSF